MRTISEVQNSVNRFRIAIRTCNSACLTIEVPRHDPLAHQLDAPHLGLDQAAPVIAHSMTHIFSNRAAVNFLF